MTADRTCSWMSSQTPSANSTSPVASLTLKWLACSSKLLVSELSSDRTSTSPMKSSVRLSTEVLPGRWARWCDPSGRAACQHGSSRVASPGPGSEGRRIMKGKCFGQRAALLAVVGAIVAVLGLTLEVAVSVAADYQDANGNVC